MQHDARHGHGCRKADRSDARPGADLPMMLVKHYMMPVALRCCLMQPGCSSAKDLATNGTATGSRFLVQKLEALLQDLLVFESAKFEIGGRQIRLEQNYPDLQVNADAELFRDL